ncbi:MAG: hypothetical protein EOO87_15075 [Pedobacter sp.]|nr:MAG: hypothetical protein EOO87_15075 [Pedobacter sp.]
MEIKNYIASGVLEAYVMGSASETETAELLKIKAKYPEVAEALFELEMDLERIAQQMSINPPPGTLEKIEEAIGGLVKVENRMPDDRPPFEKYEYQNFNKRETNNQFIEVESSSSHMRIHKAWRWVFAAVFVLGKIFLGFAIYYYLENRQALKQIEKLEKQQEVIR